MEPITHFLTGACIGRAGLNRKTAYATLAAVLAAEAADIDVLWGLRGPVEELKRHRGITHTFIAVPVVAAVAVGAVWLLDCWLRARSDRSANALSQNAQAPPALKNPGAPGPELPQPLCWGWLYLTALIAALSHLLLDWTNNYGLRPFFPFNSRWYAGNLVFIAEPVLWALFFLAFILPWLFGFVGRKTDAPRAAFRGRSWAIFALSGMVLLWGWRWWEQGQARALVENAGITTAPVKRLALEPYPINPFRWHAILETADFYQTAEINTRTGEIVSDPRQALYKPPATAAAEAAKGTRLGQVFLDWGTWAVVRDVGPEPIPGPVPGLNPPQLPPNHTWTTVEFTDLRFDYSYLGADRTPSRPPLSGWVYIVDGRYDAGEAMNGQQQR
jgi:inner membrane protein